jgi:drug/metabolite transporter (DMT)-like permease
MTGRDGGAGQIWIRAMPGLFVFLWSTGFIAAKYGMDYAGPFTLLGLRFLIVVVLMTGLAVAMRAPWPARSQWLPIAITGIFVHAGYLGGVFGALHLGVEAGIIALIAGLQPVLTGALAGPLLGERVSARQWAGLALGLAGVVLVVRTKLALGLGTPIGMVFAIICMLSITTGTLTQKKFCADMDLRTGSVIQFVASAVVIVPIAYWLEGMVITPSWTLVASLLWLCLVLSIGAVSLMFILIRSGAAAEVVSLFFLVPPTTAILGWLAFSEKLDLISLIGMAMVVAAVAMVTWKRK